jgi:hypothetical protein
MTLVLRSLHHGVIPISIHGWAIFMVFPHCVFDAFETLENINIIHRANILKWNEILLLLFVSVIGKLRFVTFLFSVLLYQQT